MSHIFISYKREENYSDFADNLIQKIRDAGFTTWRDIDELHAGEVWRVEIDQAIKNAFAMIVIMTPEAKTSEYVTYEWAFALGVGVKVIPIMLKPTELHPRLEDLQYLDFTGHNRPWPKLIDAVRKAAESKDFSKINQAPISPNIPAYIQQAKMGLHSLKATEREEAIENLAKADHPAAREVMTEELEHPLKEIRIQIAVTVRLLVPLETSPHSRAILTATRMSIPHSRAILPLKVEDIPHLFTIYQPSNSHVPYLLLPNLDTVEYNKTSA